LGRRRRCSAECSDLGAAQLDLFDALEELGVLGVRAGPAALDIVDAEGIQLTCDLDLILSRKRQPFALGAIAQGGIV
jgi:hypothetical protein